MSTEKFVQRNGVVPEYLRNGTLVRGLSAVAVDSSTDELDPDVAAAFLIRPGYFDADRCVEVLQSGGIDERRAREAVERQWSRYQDRLSSNAGEGDWAKFDAACQEMTDQGVLVRHNFTCCRTCADEEIGDERSADDPQWGYVFFTQMDAFGLAYDRASVWLGYGSFDASPKIPAAELDRARELDRRRGGDAAVRELYERTFDHLAEVITTSLAHHGLSYDWDGDTETRIRVIDMDWRRPPPTHAAEPPQPPAAPPAAPKKFTFGFG